MDTLQLALPYYICTVAAWGSAAVCGVAAWKRLRPPWVLLLAGGFGVGLTGRTGKCQFGHGYAP
jgi:hypothetical protein